MNSYNILSHIWIGQEKDAESSLGDHGVRKYEYETGRFTGIDPLWEKYIGWTPYQYSGNNPIMFLDENGMFKIAAKGETIGDHKAVDINSISPTFVDDVMNQILPFIEKTGILANIINLTGLSENTIRKDFAPHDGPKIFATPLTGLEGLDIIQGDGKFQVNSKMIHTSEKKFTDSYGGSYNQHLNERVFNMTTVIWEYLRDKVYANDELIIGVFHGLRPSRNNINYNYIKELKGILEGSNDETPTDEQ